jgi:hypothetical protein
MYATCRRILSHRHPSPSLILSMLALFFAVTGVAHTNPAATEKVINHLYVSEKVSPETTIPGGTVHTLTGKCQGLAGAMNGGFNITSSSSLSPQPTVLEDAATGPSGDINEWTVILFNPRGAEAITAQAFVTCLEPSFVAVTAP